MALNALIPRLLNCLSHVLPGGIVRVIGGWRMQI
jgi:hypothetical protein